MKNPHPQSPGWRSGIGDPQKIPSQSHLGYIIEISGRQHWHHFNTGLKKRERVLQRCLLQGSASLKIWPVPSTNPYKKKFSGRYPSVPKKYFLACSRYLSVTTFFYLAGTRYPSVPKNFFLAGTRYPSVPKNNPAVPNFWNFLGSRYPAVPKILKFWWLSYQLKWWLRKGKVSILSYKIETYLRKSIFSCV